MIKHPELIEAIAKLIDHDLYVYPEPKIMDFSDVKKQANIVIKGGGLTVSTPMPESNEELVTVFGILKCLFDKSERIIITWDIKDFLSYALSRTQIPFDIAANVYDLRMIEKFNDINLPKPQTFAEAKERLSNVIALPSWNKCRSVYTNVYYPLLSKVIPAIEAKGLVDHRLKHVVYSHYDIAGQANGRSRCEKYHSKSFNPHSLTATDKQFLKPVGFDQVLIYFDYKSMEVSVLQWLSKDEFLGKIMASGQDLYAVIWKVLTSLDCDEKTRQKCKEIFLPVVYGRGSNDIATACGLSETSAKKLVDRIYTKFPTALQWVLSQQSSVQAGLFQDYFGKVKKFDNNDYRIRNCAVQSPAALICLHKLVKLFDNLNEASIVAHIHDGFILSAHHSVAKHVKQKAVEILEAEEELYPGLRLKVSSHF